MIIEDKKHFDNFDQFALLLRSMIKTVDLSVFEALNCLKEDKLILKYTLLGNNNIYIILQLNKTITHIIIHITVDCSVELLKITGSKNANNS